MIQSYTLRRNRENWIKSYPNPGTLIPDSNTYHKANFDEKMSRNDGKGQNDET